MMWNTERGKRVLENAEAKLFADSILDMLYTGLMEENAYDEVVVFANLTYPQKIVTLHQITQALFRPEVPAPELTAVLAGTVAAILRNVYTHIELEVSDAPDRTTYRSLVGQACREVVDEEKEEFTLPADSCDDLDEWEFCVNCLRHSLLEDDDYLDDGIYVDLPPEKSEAFRIYMGVNPEYFQAIADDPAQTKMEALREELVELCIEVAETGCVKAAKSRRKPGGKKRKSNDKS